MVSNIFVLLQDKTNWPFFSLNQLLSLKSLGEDLQLHLNFLDSRISAGKKVAIFSAKNKLGYTILWLWSLSPQLLLLNTPLALPARYHLIWHSRYLAVCNTCLNSCIILEKYGLGKVLSIVRIPAYKLKIIPRKTHIFLYFLAEMPHPSQQRRFSSS